MARLNMVLADTNAEYCDFVFEYFNYRYKERFRIDCFTDTDAFIKYIRSEGQTVDLLLISIDFLSKMTSEDIEQNVKVIVELKENAETGKTKYRSVNKYSRIDDMAQRLLDIYADEYRLKDENTLPEFAGKKTLVIPVCSPEGGCGKTVIAVALALMYSSLGKKPFYLNLEKYYSPVKIFNPSTLRGISDILFYIRNQDSNIRTKITSFKCTDPDYGVDYLSPVATPRDLEETNIREVITLVQEIIYAELYDVILIDTDGSFDLLKPEFIKICTKIVVPYTQSEYGINKIKSFINNLERSFQNEEEWLRDKLILTANKTEGAAERILESYMKAPIPFPLFNSMNGCIQSVLKHDALKELYNVLNFRI
jgi:cellulose biosynthesis protein BcsQ